MARRRIVLGAIAVVVLAGGGIFLLTRGGDDSLISSVFNSKPDPLPVTFHVPNTTVQTITATSPKKVRKDARKAAHDVADVLNDLYFTGWVNYKSWGDPGEIEKYFTEDARADLEANVETLTIGPKASDTYDYVTPDKAKVKVEILTDGQDKPVQAIATVTFSATAQHDDDSYTKVTSTGTMFLKQTDGTWHIYAYRMQRHEKPTKAPPSPTTSASASGATP